jgi:methionyl-tRNA formyltransferase
VKIVFFGTPDYAVPSLAALLAEASFDVVGVVSQPDRPQGRGQKIVPTPVKALAQEKGIPVWQPERLRKDERILQALDALKADFFVVVAYGQILSPQVLAMPAKGCINGHASLLPKYRGAAPIQWCLYHGEAETGVTTMLMDAGMDTGPMLLKSAFPLPIDWNAQQLADKLSTLTAELLIKTLSTFDQITSEAQDSSQSSAAPLIRKEQYLLDWQGPVHNQVRAFYPYAYTFHQQERLRILETMPYASIGAAGKVLEVLKGQGFVVGTDTAAVLVKQVQPASKNPQSAWDYARSRGLVVGEVLRELPLIPLREGYA